MKGGYGCLVGVLPLFVSKTVVAISFDRFYGKYRRNFEKTMDFLLDM